MTWDKYFILLAQAAARKSKDPSTKVGAVVVDGENIVRSTGFNGFPRRVPDLEEDYLDREVKYRMVLHAEENALLAAARVGVPLQGCKLYCSLHPCFQCAKRIIQCGIVEVRFPVPTVEDDDAYRRWFQDMADARELMGRAGVQTRAVDMTGLQLF